MTRTEHNIPGEGVSSNYSSGIIILSVLLSNPFSIDPYVLFALLTSPVYAE